MKITLVLVSLLIVSAHGAIKRWVGPDNNYDNPLNWAGSSLPCAADNAKFQPTWSPTTVFIQNNIQVNSLIFPVDGTFVLVNALNITLGGTPTPKCPGTDKMFTGQAPGNWDDPTNWEVRDSTTNSIVSTATLSPSDRVPCSTDTVRFPPQSAVTVQVNRPVTVNQFFINNKYLGPASLRQFLASSTGLGQFRLPSSSAISLGPGCVAGALCQCGNTKPDTIRAVCSYANPTCSVASGCVGPVMLDGDCCAVCGAIMNITSTALDMAKLESTLAANIEGAWRFHIVDSSHVQVLIIGNDQVAHANDVKKRIVSNPLGFGLSSAVQVDVTGSIVPTTVPPTTDHEVFTLVGKGCVVAQDVTDASNEVVTDPEGKPVTEFVLVKGQEPVQPPGASTSTSTDSTPWIAVGAIGGFMFIILLIVIILLARRGNDKKSPPASRPVHYVHHGGNGAAVNMSDFGDPTASATQLDLYEDPKVFGGYRGDSGGVTNPIYHDDGAQLIGGGDQGNVGINNPIYNAAD